MHELSIAMGIVKIAEDEAKKISAKEVLSIEIEVGELSGIEVDSLDFVWSSAVENSVLEKASKKITVIKGKGKCVDCDTLFDVENIYDACPNCNSFFKSILKGKELKVKKLELI